MKARPTKRARKATWLAFGLVALAAVSASAQDSNDQKEATSTTDIPPVATSVDGVNSEATVSLYFGSCGFCFKLF